MTENSYVWIKSNVLKALEDQADHNKKNPPNVLFKSLIKALIGEDQLIKTSASHIPVRLFSAVQSKLCFVYTPVNSNQFYWYHYSKKARKKLLRLSDKDFQKFLETLPDITRYWNMLRKAYPVHMGF